MEDDRGPGPRIERVDTFFAMGRGGAPPVMERIRSSVIFRNWTSQRPGDGNIRSAPSFAPQVQRMDTFHAGGRGPLDLRAPFGERVKSSYLWRSITGRAPRDMLPAESGEDKGELLHL